MTPGTPLSQPESALGPITQQGAGFLDRVWWDPASSGLMMGTPHCSPASQFSPQTQVDWRVRCFLVLCPPSRDHEHRVWLTSAGSLESTAWKSAGRSRHGPGKARPRGVPCRNGGGCQRSQTAPGREETLGSAARNHPQRETPNCPSAEDRYTDHGRWTRGLFLNREENTQHHQGIPRLYEG